MTLSTEEVLRYLRADGAEGETRRMTEEMAVLLQKTVRPRFCWKVFRIERTEGGIDLPEAGIRLEGTLARGMLKECSYAALTVCTLGAGFDAMEKQWEKRDMARAVVLDACGSAWTEAGCDAAEREIAGRFPGMYLTDRFSPGYGDLPLALQEALLRATDAGRRLGVTVNGSNLLIPVKTATAIIGISEKPQGAKIRGCAFCSLRKDCEYRKRGTGCEI